MSEPMALDNPSLVTCEDCDNLLPSTDTDISMEGVDDRDGGIAECACRSCGRRVCGMCAVVEVGAGRECLQCRTSTRKKRDDIDWIS